MSLEFTKYQGLGNDFILIDNRHSKQPLITSEEAVNICDRHFGIGADGVIFALPGEGENSYTMRIFNSDGSEPEMCGNGIRCLAQFITELEGKEEIGKIYPINTLAGVIKPKIEGNGQIRVDMGKPELIAQNIPTTLKGENQQVINQPLHVMDKEWFITCVSMGNPHCITFVDNVETFDLENIGPKFEHNPVFPQRINAEFVQVISKDYLKMRVWERGAGITLACGTGACATVVAAVLNEKADRKCTVELPGGCLKIEWSQDNGHLYMTGPAQKVFSGKLV